MVGAHGVEMAVAVGEMAEFAMGALELRHEYFGRKAKRLECVEAEGELDLQRKENMRLRATIAMYEQTFLRLKNQSTQKGDLPAECFTDLFEQVRKRVASPAFIEKLRTLPALADEKALGETMTKEEDMFVKADVHDPNWWLWLSENNVVWGEPTEVHDAWDSDGYVLVNQEDIVDSIANYIAHYISAVPQAKNLSPQELEKAMTQAFAKVEKKGRFQNMWKTGKFIYTTASWGATAVGIYKNPVVIRAASMAVWTSCCIILKALK